MDESLKAQLQATLDMIQAFTWLAAPSGALLFVNSRCADYLGLPKDHPLRFGTVTGASDKSVPKSNPDQYNNNAAPQVPPQQPSSPPPALPY